MKENRSAFDIFNDQYERELSKFNNKQRAFDITSTKFSAIAGYEPYSSYDSFRTIKSRRRKATKSR